jgi:CelD/BcsL family acetyltransferase involved in cellulose biosynthesis
MWSECFSRSWTLDHAAAGRGVRVIDAPADMARLQLQWASLARCGSPMQQFAWSVACAESFASAGLLRLVVLEESGRLAAIAPMVATGKPPRVCLLGLKELFEPTDFVCREPRMLESLLRALASTGIAIALDRIPADSPSIPAVRAAYGWRGFTRIRSNEPFPYIPLDARLPDPERLLNARRRSDLRRARRRADSIGPVRFEVFAPGAAEVDRLLDAAFAVEAAGWKGARGSALACSSRLGAFFRRYARLAAEEGILRLAFMWIGERAVATQIALEHGRRFWLLKIGYDESAARCSPGTLLMAHTIGHAAERGLESYELLGVSEHWTRVWTAAERPSVKVRAYPWSASGASWFAKDLWDAARRRALRLARASEDA